jgi:hypothetical protein
LAARYGSGTPTCMFRLNRHMCLVVVIYSWVSHLQMG